MHVEMAIRMQACSKQATELSRIHHHEDLARLNRRPRIAALTQKSQLPRMDSGIDPNNDHTTEHGHSPQLDTQHVPVVRRLRGADYTRQEQQI